ncbi:nucleoside hydrolase [Flavobacterium sp. XS2P12]|uniref:nucleoside hydrolase n=1 Tax=Flavobacterium melibiosi TaxID=3398734 RepID=UPI003A86D9AE
MLSVFASTNLFAQVDLNPKKLNLFDKNTVKPRMRIIIDNDFGGDPDGLFELVQHLLSPSVEIKGIIGSHLKPGDGFDNSNSTALNAKNKVLELLKIMQLQHNYNVYQGSNEGLKDLNTPQQSAAASFIIKEAMREDTKLPLYMVCGAGLTDLASAYLLEPKIADRLTLIWIGGPEYSDIASPPPGYTSLEYNLGIDIKAGQVIFNNSQIPIWQVPRDAYRQVLLPYSSLLLKVKNQGETGDFLGKSVEKIMSYLTSVNYPIGETYILGDSPLVLLTALQSSFEADPSSSQYVLRPSPLINEQGLYEVNTKGRNIRVYKKLDVGLLMDDFYSKLTLFQQNKK